MSDVFWYYIGKALLLIGFAAVLFFWGHRCGWRDGQDAMIDARHREIDRERNTGRRAGKVYW